MCEVGSGRRRGVVASDQTKQAVKNAISAAKQKWGAGWSRLGEDTRQAYVRAEVLTQIAAMDAKTVSADVCRRIITIAAAACQAEV